MITLIIVAAVIAGTSLLCGFLGWRSKMLHRGQYADKPREKIKFKHLEKVKGFDDDTDEEGRK